MTVPNNAPLYTQGFGSQPNLPIVYLASAPSSSQTNYPLGQLAIVQSSNTTYQLTSFSSSNGVTRATWTLLGAGSGDLNTLTTQDSTVVMPTSGNINLSGAGSTTTVGSGSTATVELTGLTNHAVLVGAGTTTITKLSVGTTGTVLTGSTGGDPAFASLGTNSGLTAHGVLIGEGNSAIVGASVGSTGQVLIGSTGADPAFGALGVNSALTGLVLGNTNSAFTTTTYTAAGSFTPAFSLATPGDSAWTYGASGQIGRYTRLGAVVFFTATVTWTNFTNTTGSGNWQMNLPVTAGSFANAGQVAISGTGIDAGAETANLPANFLGVVGTGASIVVLSVEEGGIGNSASALFPLTVTQVLPAGTLNITGFYFAA